MNILKTGLPHLWKIAQELPYKEHKFSTCIREFTPSYAKRQAPFILDKPLVQPTGIEPVSMALQTTAMTTSAKVA